MYVYRRMYTRKRNAFPGFLGFSRDRYYKSFEDSEFRYYEDTEELLCASWTEGGAPRLLKMASARLATPWPLLRMRAFPCRAEHAAVTKGVP